MVGVFVPTTQMGKLRLGQRNPVHKGTAGGQQNPVWALLDGPWPPPKLCPPASRGEGDPSASPRPTQAPIDNKSHNADLQPRLALQPPPPLVQSPGWLCCLLTGGGLQQLPVLECRAGRGLGGSCCQPGAAMTAASPAHAPQVQGSEEDAPSSPSLAHASPCHARAALPQAAGPGPPSAE